MNWLKKIFGKKQEPKKEIKKELRGTYTDRISDAHSICKMRLNNPEIDDGDFDPLKLMSLFMIWNKDDEVNSSHKSEDINSHTNDHRSDDSYNSSNYDSNNDNSSQGSDNSDSSSSCDGVFLSGR